MVRLTGNFYTSAGVATCGAAVAIFPVSTAATQSTSVCSATATTTTNSTGVWDELTLAANTYDVRITSGSSVRWRRYNEEVQHTTFQTGDDGNFYLGNGIDVGHRWSTGDASNHAYVIGIGDTSQQMHITDMGAIATDWARSAGTHPELAIHSNTTPITDYMAIGNHDGTTGNIDVVGGTTLALKIAGNTEASITAAGLVLPACSDLSFTGSTGTNDIVLTNGLADALSITDGSADVVVVDTSTAGNVITMTSAVTVSNGLTSTAAANTLGATSFNDADVTNVGDIALDSISADGTDINIAVDDNSATALTIKQGSDAYLIIDTANSSESVSIGTGISGTAITLGHGTSEVTVADNLTVAGDMTVNGTTTTVNSTTLTVDDPIITLGGDTAPGSDDNKDRGVEFRYHDGSCARIGFFGYDDSASVFTGLTVATNSSEVFSGTVMNAVFGDIGGTLTTAAQANVTTLAGLTSLGAAGATTNVVAGDVTMYNAVNNGNPTISLGSASAERLIITTNYDACAQTLCNVEFATAAASGTANKGKFVFDVDGTDIATIDDGGIDIASGKTFSINGSDISTSDTTYTAGDGLTLTGTDFDLDAALTTVTSVYNASLKVGRDAGNLIDFATTDNKLIFRVECVNEVELVQNALSPVTSDGVALGTGSLMWSDAFLASGAVVNFNNGDVALTHSACTLTMTGGALTVGVCGTGHDVKFFGCLAGAYMLYDESEEQLEIRGSSANAATSTGKLLLTTAQTAVDACDVIGSINFQAPVEAGGTDAITIAAGIRAVAQATFTCAVNATDLIFYTGHSEAATEKFRFTSQGEIGVGGANYGTDGQVLTSGGDGAAAAWEDAGGGGGVVSGSVDNAVLRADGTGGSTSQGSGVIIADCNDVTIPKGGASATGASLAIETYNDAGNPARMRLRTSKHDTQGTHGAVTANLPLGYIQFEGSDGDSFERSSVIAAFPTQTWSGSAQGSRLEFYTTADCATCETLRMTIENNGSTSLENNTLLNVGAAGNDWTANQLALSSSYAGVNQLLIKNTNTGACYAAEIMASAPDTDNAAVDPRLVANITGALNWVFGIDNSGCNRLYISNSTVGGNSDGIRITNASPPVVSFNTGQGSDFDYVCANCGKHGLEPFICCGLVEWHDDVLSLRKASVDLATMANPYEQGQSLNVAHLVKLGIMDYDSDNSPGDWLSTRETPWLGLNMANAQMFTWAGMWQTRELVDGNHACHEARIKELEAKLGGCSG
jgi:hypothetical protein